MHKRKLNRAIAMLNIAVMLFGQWTVPVYADEGGMDSPPAQVEFIGAENVDDCLPGKDLDVLAGMTAIAGDAALDISITGLEAVDGDGDAVAADIENGVLVGPVEGDTYTVTYEAGGASVQRRFSVAEMYMSGRFISGNSDIRLVVGESVDLLGSAAASDSLDNDYTVSVGGIYTSADEAGEVRDKVGTLFGMAVSPSFKAEAEGDWIVDFVAVDSDGRIAAVKRKNIHASMPSSVTWYGLETGSIGAGDSIDFMTGVSAELNSEKLDVKLVKVTFNGSEIDVPDGPIAAENGRYVATYNAYRGGKLVETARKTYNAGVKKAALSKAPLKAPNANADIEYFIVQFVSGGTYDANADTYVWKADYSYTRHKFIFRVNYATSGVGERAPRQVEIRVPKTILLDKMGNHSDQFEMSVPLDTDISADNTTEEFVYRIEGDDIVFYNRLEVSAAVNGYFEVAYSTTKNTYAYRDTDYSRTRNHLPFHGTLKVSNGTNTSTATSENLYVEIDTTAKIRSTEKCYPTLYRNWQSSWGNVSELMPGDSPSEYYYLVWRIKTEIEEYTQKYTFTLDDGPVIGEILSPSPTRTGDASLVGYRMPGESVYSDKNTITGQTSSLIYAYVLTRHRKLDFAPGEMTTAERASVTDPEDQALLEKGVATYSVYNRISAKVIPEDLVDAPSTARSAKTFVWHKPFFAIPIGHFETWKYGDENWNRCSGVQKAYSSYALDSFQEQRTDITDLTYNVVGDGFPTPWTLEGNDAYDPSKYYKYDVTYDISDNELYLINPLDRTIDHEWYNLNSNLVAGELDDLKLKPEDYDFASLKIKVLTARAEYINTLDYIGLKEYPIGDSYDNDVHLYLYVEEGGGLVCKEACVFRTQGPEEDPGRHPFIVSSTDVYRTYVKFSDYTFWAGGGNRIYTEFKFNPGVKGYRLTTTNHYFETRISAVPSVTIHSTEHTQKLVRNNNNEPLDTVILKNASDMKVTSNNPKHPDTIFYNKKIIGDRIRGLKKSSIITKDITSVSRSTPIDKKISIGWKIRANENILTGRAGSYDYIFQNGAEFGRNYGGIIYDLLPAGAQLDKDSVHVKVREKEKNSYSTRSLASSEYEVTLIDNYAPEGSTTGGSGRTLLKITIYTPGYEYTATFNTIHGWETLTDFGKKYVNPAAYETGNNNIKHGCKPGTSADDLPFEQGQSRGIKNAQNRKYMYNLDPAANVAGTNEEVGRFLFTEYSADISALTAAVSGLNKKVLGKGDIEWSYDTTVCPSENYKYRWRFSNTYVTKAKDMIFFDSLENYKAHGIYESDWHFEKLLYIDTTQMETMFQIAPVVYLSTAEKLDLSKDANHDITNSSIWQEKSAFLINHELSDARAIAIDIRKKTDGSDFVLKEGKGVECVLCFQAPSDPRSVAYSKGRYPETYNNIYIQDTIIDLFGNEKDFYIHQDYTTVRYHVAVPVTLYKYSSANVIDPYTPDSPIAGTTFRLTGVSDYGTEVDIKAQSNIFGRITFNDIERGTYKLSEYECSDDWQKSEIEYTVVVGDNGHVALSYVDVETGNIKEYDISAPDVNMFPEPSEGNKILNDQRIHTDIEFYKRELGRPSSRIEGVQFQLSGTSGDAEHVGYGNYINMIATSELSGRVVFPNVELGTYKLKEIKTADGYVLYDKEMEVVVDANGNFAVRQPDDTGKMQPAIVDSKGRITIENEKKHILAIFKQSSRGERKAVPGATFKLWGVSDYGHAYEEEVTSGSDGLIYFKHLESGTYMLQETAVEGNYVRDDTVRIVKIGKDETVPNFITVEGCEKDEYGYFDITNTEVPNDTIIVIKQWEDDKTGQAALPVSEGGERPIPVFHISKTDPSSIKTIHFDANGGKFKVSGQLADTKDVWYNFSTSPFRQVATKGVMEDKRYEVPTVPENDNLILKGWYTDKDCSDGNEVEFVKTGNGDFVPKTALEDGTTLYAKWGYGIKYAVSLYGIEMAEDENGNTMGLTFGPATGFRLVSTADPYIGEPATGPFVTPPFDLMAKLDPERNTENPEFSYVAHNPSGVTEHGHEHKCIHNTKWEDIIHWNKVDPYVFEQCIACGCTRSVTLNPNLLPEDQTIFDTTFADNPCEAYKKGDGPSVLNSELCPSYAIEFEDETFYSKISENLRWHPNNNRPGDTGENGTNYEGWGASRIRAMLNGCDYDLTDMASDNMLSVPESELSVAHPSAGIYTDENCLLAAFPEELQEAIGKQAVRYDSVYNEITEENLKISYDKLWLLSSDEIWTENRYDWRGYNHPFEPSGYIAFERFKKFIPALRRNADQFFTFGFGVSSASEDMKNAVEIHWWLRSTFDDTAGYDQYVSDSFDGNNVLTVAHVLMSATADKAHGVAPCFSLSR